MGYDDVFPYMGEFGTYQRRIYLLVCLPAISCAFHKMAGVFLLAKPDFRCQLPFEFANASYSLNETIFAQSYPIDGFTKKRTTCQYFDTNYTDEYFNSGIPANKTVTCSEYIYDHSKYASSTVTDWDMVCNRAWLTATSEALFMVGVLLGSIIFGQMSDNLGRKPVFFASLVLQLIFGITAGIAPEYITYTISRIIVGATTSGVFLVAYVIAMEMVGPTYRLFAGVVSMMFFSFGYMLIGAFAYFIKDWRYLQIALTVPSVLFMVYYWFIPESARWLLSKKRKDDAIVIIKKAAKENKVTIPQEVYDNLIDESATEVKKEPVNQPSVLDLFRYPNLRKKSLLIFFDWFVNSGTYYALSWNTSNLGGNDIINFVIAGAVEIPGYLFLLFTLNRWGRRNILCGCMLAAGTLLLLTWAVPDGNDWLIVTLAMLGKMAITASYGTVYIFSAEQFPTPVRNVGLGASSMVARIGGILAPYINSLNLIWKPLPLILLGACAFAGGLLSLFLPETLNKKLPETIEEGENFGKKVKIGDVEADAEELKVLHVDKKVANGNGTKDQ